MNSVNLSYSSFKHYEDLLTSWVTWVSMNLNSPLVRDYGLSALLSNVQRGRIVKLQNDDLALITHGELILDDSYLLTLLDSNLPQNTKDLRFLLYAVHELLHYSHGIEIKERVRAVKSVSQDLLLKFDLEADHMAAMVITRYLKHISLAEVKNEQGHSLLDFPVNAHHTLSSRSRKAKRLVSLRADYLLTDLLNSNYESKSGYISVEYHLDSSKALLIRSGMPTKLISVRSITKEEILLFEACVDECDSLHKIERVTKIDDLIKQIWGDLMCTSPSSL